MYVFKLRQKYSLCPVRFPKLGTINIEEKTMTGWKAKIWGSSILLCLLLAYLLLTQYEQIRIIFGFKPFWLSFSSFVE